MDNLQVEKLIKDFFSNYSIETISDTFDDVIQQTLNTKNENIEIVKKRFTMFRELKKLLYTLQKEQTSIVKNNDVQESKLLCSNCKTPFTPKNARHKYCTDSCRLEAWQAKNGTTIFGTK